VLRFTEG